MDKSNGENCRGFLHKKTRDAFHKTCFLCGPDNPNGFKLNFAVGADGSISAVFPCFNEVEGYKGFVHGGVAASLIDSAMANCLFAKGVSGLTAELNIKYKSPVLCGKPATVRAWVEKDYAPLYLLKAEITQDGVSVVSADAKFMQNDNVPR